MNESIPGDAVDTAVVEATKETSKPVVTAKVAIPTIKDLLKVGAQFGHETKRWNPKMGKYIFGDKNKIHIIDINKTEEKLKESTAFLVDAASRGNVLFVGTKRQASLIVREEAIRAGAYFITVRWAGGLLTNFPVVKKSLNKLNALEKSFEEGVEDRTKFEVSRMKKEWQRLDRLYSGIKALNDRPTAVVVVDANFEKSAIRESRKMRIPVVGVVDTNSDPDTVDYIVPANDDAVGSITLMVKTLADAVLAGNKGNGIKHHLKDYDKAEIKITKKEVIKEEVATVSVPETDGGAQFGMGRQDNRASEAPRPAARGKKVKGLLERAKEDAVKKKTDTSTSLSAGSRDQVSEEKKPVAKKPATKEEKKPAAKAKPAAKPKAKAKK